MGFARARLSGAARSGLAGFLARGFHGDMGWLAGTAERRGDPQKLWGAARSAVVLGLNYGPQGDPLAVLDLPARAAVSVYAQGRDYHRVMRRRLRALGRWMAESFDCEVRTFVDTAPVMEKPLARRAGVGWQGKHTNLVSRTRGSWLFLAEILTTLDLAPDAPAADACGTCRRCLDACPTAAFPAPYRLDATRCISYLTIEHKGHIAREFRAAIGNRVYGCDDCLAACPWNKFARLAADAELRARPELAAPRLAALAGLDDSGFRALFSGTAVKRTGRDRFVRNVAVAIGNSRDPGLAPAAERLLADPSPLVRAMAVWALSRLLPEADFDRLRARRAGGEPDPDVAAEWWYDARHDGSGDAHRPAPVGGADDGPDRPA